jgi:hypothetical protein
MAITALARQNKEASEGRLDNAEGQVLAMMVVIVEPGGMFGFENDIGVGGMAMQIQGPSVLVQHGWERNKQDHTHMLAHYSS